MRSSYARNAVGAAIAVISERVDAPTILTVADTKFYGSEADHYGKAVYSYLSGVTITNAVVDNAESDKTFFSGGGSLTCRALAISLQGLGQGDLGLQPKQRWGGWVWEGSLGERWERGGCGREAW